MTAFGAAVADAIGRVISQRRISYPAVADANKPSLVGRETDIAIAKLKLNA